MATSEQTTNRQDDPSRDKGKFAPGYSGNPGGRPKRKPFQEELIKQLAANPDKLASIMKTALDKAELGDDRFFKELRDMLDGKPAQPIEGSEDGPPISVKINLNFE